MAGRMINGAAALTELVRTAGETEAPGVHRVLPVVPELSGLLPGRGLRRGSTVSVATGRAAPASGGTSLLLALLSAASRAGSWCAVVGVPALGAIAAAESGIALDRFALVPDPGPEWPTVVAALIDGLDVVVAAVPGTVSASVTGRLAARARQRGSVLVPFGHWDGADVALQVTQGHWEGLGTGLGRLRRRRVTVLARGRGAAARPREITLWMPTVTVNPPRPPSAAHPPVVTGRSRPPADSDGSRLAADAARSRPSAGAGRSGSSASIGRSGFYADAGRSGSSVDVGRLRPFDDAARSGSSADVGRPGSSVGTGRSGSGAVPAGAADSRSAALRAEIGRTCPGPVGTGRFAPAFACTA